MDALTKNQAMKTMLGIILSVENGTMTPEQAVREQEGLLKQAPEGFKADYTRDDFEKIRADALSVIATQGLYDDYDDYEEGDEIFDDGPFYVEDEADDEL